MKRFAIVEKKDEKSKQIKQHLQNALTTQGYTYDEQEPELVISIGGDGTLLYAVHEYLDRLEDTYFIAVHTGTLGFFTDYREEELDTLIQDILEDNVYEIFVSQLLETEVHNKKHYALNEMRIENIVNTQTMDIYIDGEFFEAFKGNGMCLSTQAGSTAYNRSLNGAVVDSGLSLLQLSEIAGIHDARHRSLDAPYILKDDRSVSFKATSFENAKLCYDYLQIDLDDIKEITCKLSKKSVRFLRYRKYSYLERVRNLY